MSEETRRIVCSANRYLSNGMLILGIRHWDRFMHQQATNLENEGIVAAEDHRNMEQGFVDQFGNFLTREEAWEIASSRDQIVRTGQGFSGPKLYSENLY